MLAATSYMWIYCASDPKDAEDKHANHMVVLDRTKMWDATAIRGCKNNYAFETVRGDTLHPNTNLRSRTYPCPCQPCRSGSKEQECLNMNIVGRWTYHHSIMKPKGTPLAQDQARAIRTMNE